MGLSETLTTVAVEYPPTRSKENFKEQPVEKLGIPVTGSLHPAET